MCGSVQTSYRIGLIVQSESFRATRFRCRKPHYVRKVLLVKSKVPVMKYSMLLGNKMKRPLLLAVLATFAAGCATSEPMVQSSPEPVSWVGPAGPAGPAGATGAQGATGQTGAMGAAIAGPDGPVGATGPAGMQGPTGATGATGRMVVGRAGATGPVGATGAQGATGQTGAQGSSIAGPAGARGATGPAGITGDMGGTGAEGLTTVGPTGPTGVAGVTGGQGVTGYTGAQGSTEMAGVAGQSGATGAAGPQGATGTTGVRGPMAEGGSWSPYRNYAFNAGSDTILVSDGNKAWEVAQYMNQNPSYRVAIDGANGRRVSNVRDALINAGVPAYKIQTGSYGDPQLRRDDRVAVLMSNR